MDLSPPLFITSCHIFWMCSTPSARPLLLMFHTDRIITQINSSLDLYRVLRSGTFTLAKKSWSHGLISVEYGGCSWISHCQRRKRSVSAAVWLLALSWKRWGSVPPSVVVCSWVHAITISSPKWRNHCEGPGTIQDINLSILYGGGQYGTSSEMDKLMVYDSLQTFGKRC